MKASIKPRYEKVPGYKAAERLVRIEIILAADAGNVKDKNALLTLLDDIETAKELTISAIPEKKITIPRVTLE
jgi:hypothetical protein